MEHNTWLLRQVVKKVLSCFGVRVAICHIERKRVKTPNILNYIKLYRRGLMVFFLIFPLFLEQTTVYNICHF